MPSSLLHPPFTIPASAAFLFGVFKEQHSRLLLEKCRNENVRKGGRDRQIPADLLSCLHLGAEPTTSGAHFSTGLFPDEHTTSLNLGQE